MVLRVVNTLSMYQPHLYMTYWDHLNKCVSVGLDCRWLLAGVLIQQLHPQWAQTATLCELVPAGGQTFDLQCFGQLCVDFG